MEYVQMTLNDWVEMKQKLKMELMGVKQSFVRIGFALRKIEDQRLYEQDGYKSITEFAKAEYGLEPSTTSRFISINKEYSVDGYSEHLREEYLDMGRSQLEEMLKLPESDRQMIQPETPRADIRELKRFNKADPVKGVADDVRQLIENFYKDNPEILNGVFSEKEDFQDTLERKIEIVNPSGNRSYKKGLFFLMMYEDGIKIKKFGSDPETMSWSEFFAITQTIFGEVAAGEKTWKNYFGGSTDERGEYEEKNSGGGNKVDGSSGSLPGDEEGNGRGDESDVSEDDSTSDAGIGDTREDTVAADITDEADHTGTGTAEDDSGADKEGTGATERSDEPNAEEIEQEEKAVAPAQKTAEILNEPVIEVAKEEQIQGQKYITDYPEVIPEAMEVVENVEIIVEEKLQTRKEYLDNCTEYGAALYLHKWYQEDECAKEILSDLNRMESWLKEKVDINGRDVDGE